MRWKIIIVNAAIVAIVGLLSFVILSTSLADILADPAASRVGAERAVRAANAQFSLTGLRLERWLAGQAATDAVRGVFDAGTVEARREGATTKAKEIFAVAQKELASTPLSLVLFVDAGGIALGRNDSNQMRGDNMGQEYPSVSQALASGLTRTDFWISRRRGEQMVASYAPVRGENGQVVGLLVGATPLSDGLLERVSELTTGKALIVGVATDAGALEVIAKGGLDSTPLASVLGPTVQSQAARALASGFTIVSAPSERFTVGAAPLAEAESSNALLIAAVPRSAASVTGVLWPILAVSVLGLVLVFLGGMFISNYISQPISSLEEGLLSVINGNTDLRFELEHPDLGGLVFRINSLLNALTGTPETDEEGRTSRPPEQPYSDA